MDNVLSFLSIELKIFIAISVKPRLINILIDIFLITFEPFFSKYYTIS